MVSPSLSLPRVHHLLHGVTIFALCDKKKKNHRGGDVTFIKPTACKIKGREWPVAERRAGEQEQEGRSHIYLPKKMKHELVDSSGSQG